MHKHQRFRRALSGVTAIALVMCATIDPLQVMASPWQPRLLVNTEAFETIDDADASANVYIRFGDTLQKTLTFERSLGRFNFNDDLYISGDLEVSGTASGASVHAQNTLTSSGTLTVSGNAEVRGTLSGANLTVMQGTDSYFLGRVGVGTTGVGDEGVVKIDSAKGYFESGDFKTVEISETSTNPAVSGDVYALYTTALGTNDNTSNIGGYFRADNAGTVLDEFGIVALSGEDNSAFVDDSAGVVAGVSDSTAGSSIPAIVLVKTNEGGVGGSQNGPGILFMAEKSSNQIENAAEIAGIFEDATNGTALKGSITFSTAAGTMGALSEKMRLTNSGSLGIGTSLPETALEAVGTLSGSSITISNLRNCNTIDTDGTGNFTCGVDDGGGGGISQSDGDNRYVNISGDTMTGGLTISGYGGALAASGSIRTEGDMILNQDNSDSDAVLTFGNDAGAQSITYSNANLLFSFSDDIGTTGNITGSGTLTVDGAMKTKNDFTLNSDQGAADAVLTFGSDATSETIKFLNNEDRFEFSDDLRVTGGTFASGSLIVDGAASFKSTVRINGVTYTFPYSDGSASGKVLKTNAAGQLSWSTDSTGAGGGISYSEAESWFVNDTGDTMTGALNIAVTGGNNNTVALELPHTASGRVMHAQDRLASSGVIVLRTLGSAQPNFYANGSRKVGINTGSPHSAFTSSGSFATSRRIVTATGSITDQDQVIFASGSKKMTLTLPTAVGINGRQYTIKKIDTALDALVTIKANGSEKIDGLSSWILFARGQEVTLASNNVGWNVISHTNYGVNGYYARGTTMNQWYSAPADSTALTTAVHTTTATLRAIPFVAERILTIDAMGIAIQTTAASSEVRLGIYRDNGNAYPGDLVVDVGTVATTATGLRSLCPSGCTTTSAGLPVTIQPGLYWLVSNNNSIAFTARGFAVANLNSVTGYPSGITTLRVVGWNIANSYAAFPTPFPASANATTAVPIPAILVRVLY